MTNKEKLISKLFKGTCSRDELESLLKLMKESPNENYEKVMEKLWYEMSDYPELEPEQAEGMMRQLFGKIRESESRKLTETSTQEVEKKTLLRRRRFLQIGRAAVLLLLVSVLSWLWVGNNDLMISETAVAEQLDILLPDGSRVKLNASSSIKYHENWDNKESRRVWLEGEAYFEVQRKDESGQKFEVITEDLTVQVLGTIFNVNAREKSTKVFLEEGKVRLDLKKQRDNIIMEPGELLTYSRSSGESTKKQIEKEAPASWKDGTAILRDALLADIIQKIHELYEVKVLVEDKSNLNRNFTIFLPVDDPNTGFSMLQGLGLQVHKAENIWTIK